MVIQAAAVPWSPFPGGMKSFPETVVEIKLALVNHLFIFRLPFFLRLFVHRYRQDNFSVSFFQGLTSMEKWDTLQQEKTLGYFGAVKIILSP